MIFVSTYIQGVYKKVDDLYFADNYENRVDRVGQYSNENAHLQ